MVRGNKKFRLSLMQNVAKMMTVVITLVTALTISPSQGHAMTGTAPLVSATAEVSSDNTIVTLAFNSSASPTTSLADLKSKIQLERSGSDTFIDLSADNANNEIDALPNGTVVITLDTALTGNTNAIHVAAGSIMNVDNVPSDQEISISNISAHDITPPAFIGANSSNGNNVYLNFDEGFLINAPQDADEDQRNAFLQSKMSIATDGEHFVSVTAQQGDIYQNGSGQIYLNYDNMKVILGTNTIIKVASGTLKDEAGNLNGEMSLQVSPPVIQSTSISSDNHDVTITFNEDVIANTDSLKNYISLIRGSNPIRKNLVEGDTVKIESGKLSIHFMEALSGTTNQIAIDGEALKDSAGNVENNSRLTAPIEANVGGIDPAPADTTQPAFLNYYFSNSYQDLNFVFDEDVLNAMTDDASFLQNVQWYGDGGYWRYSLPSDATVTFSGHVATIHFAAPLTGYQYYFSFYPGHFKDAAGNVINNSINTNWTYPHNTDFGTDDIYFSHDGRWMSLEFNSNTDLVDKTLIDGVSHLKEQITLSTDGGVTYTALDPQDVVTVQGYKINIFFHNPKQQGSVKVKVAANVISDLYDTLRNSAVDEEVAYNTPEISGYVLSNHASEFVFADNLAWRSHVREVIVYDSSIGTDRVLTSSEYKLNEGKLTISKGVFQEGHYYRVDVDAEGYSSQHFEGQAYKSSEIFYITAPVVSVDNGITAKINLFNNASQNDSIGNQTVLFELFNGTTPVSIVAANLKVNTGTYSANFNVSDAATNTNYTVKVFVVSKYSSDTTSLGLNLATVKTQLEIDQAMSNVGNNNHNND